MSMHWTGWWPVVTLVVMAAVVDLDSRHIPNWLVLPFLAAGVVVNPEGSSDLVSALRTKGIHPHPRWVLDNPAARVMPYAPAIAIGTIFSFFAM
jgi:Flp pilus assembly protein protease CpaA